MDFQFLNNDIWLKYTQAKYLSLKDIKYRLDKSISSNQWDAIARQIQQTRQASSIPFYVPSLSKTFWFFPSDSILLKINNIEQLGSSLFRDSEQKNVKNNLVINSLIEESISSAIYEGANSSRAKAKRLIASNKSANNKDEMMLLNNYHTMLWIKENLILSIDAELIKKIHSIVTAGTFDGDDVNFYGKFRNDAVIVGNHEGVDHNSIPNALNDVISIISNTQRTIISPILKGIILHYFIAYIHPFFDGNGRTARALFYFKTMKNDLKFMELLSISSHLEKSNRKYETSFDLVKEHDLDMTYFIDFCLDSLSYSLTQIQRKMDYLSKIETKIGSHFKLHPNQIKLLQKMSLNKYVLVDIEDYAKMIGKSREISRLQLKDLYEKKILKQRPDKRKTKYLINDKWLKDFIRKNP